MSTISSRESAGGFRISILAETPARLYEALQPVRLVSPESIRKLIDIPEPMTEAAQNALDEFAAKLAAKGDARFTLDRNSSDLLLVLLLPKVANYIVSSSGDAVSDGVARLRGLLPAFKNCPRWKAEVQLMHPFMSILRSSSPRS